MLKQPPAQRMQTLLAKGFRIYVLILAVVFGLYASVIGQPLFRWWIPIVAQGSWYR